MTDSVTLYRQATRPNTLITVDLIPVGEFVSRPWCKPHNLPLEDPSECMKGYYLSNGACEPTDEPIGVQVIPDDH